MNEELQNEYVDVNVHDDYPSSDEHVTVPPMKVLPLKKICMTIGQLPTAYLETMTYYEMLLWFIAYLRDNIIPTVNNNGEALEEVQTIVMSLQNYINNFKDSIDQDVEDLETYMNDYFENLDVQDEINNKLEQMLEAGELDSIIEQFLQLNALWCYDTVADMKLATNLVDGSVAKTLGYHSVNDGGMSYYKIRTKTVDDVIDEASLVAVYNNTLVAELIITSILTPEQCGAYGDGVHDDTTAITKAQTLSNKVLMKKIYAVNNLNINKNVECTGTINGNVVINTGDITFNFNIINGELKVTDSSSELLQFIKIKGNRIINEEGNGLVLESSDDGIQYCDFSIGLIRATKNIYFKGVDAGGHINNNYFHDMNVSYGTGIISDAYTNTNTYNGNYFEKIGFEDITKWFDLYTFKELSFKDCRMIPFEADGQGTTVRELGKITNSKQVTIEGNATGVYYQFITIVSSQDVWAIGKVKMNDGVWVGNSVLFDSNGVQALRMPQKKPYFNFSELPASGTLFINEYTYDLNSPLIFDYTDGGGRYLYVNIQIPTAIVNAIKYVDVAIVGDQEDYHLTLTLNNVTIKEIHHANDSQQRLFLN